MDQLWSSTAQHQTCGWEGSMYRGGRLRIPSVGANLVASSSLQPLLQAARTLHLPCHAFNTLLDLTPALSHSHLNFIFIDLRDPAKLCPETLIKSLVGSVAEDCVLVGVAELASFRTNPSFTSHWLDMGVHQVVVETDSSLHWRNEVVQLVRTYLHLHTLNLTNSILSTALDTARDIIQITDKHDNMVWMNGRGERELGWMTEELEGTCISTIQTTGHSTNLEGEMSNNCDKWLLSRLEEGKEWEGPINCKRKTGDYLTLQSKVIPLPFPMSRRLEYILYIKQPWVASPVIPRHNRNCSVIRRPSQEVNSFEADILKARRRSSGKSHNNSIEAPITKVLNIILAAQENQPVYIAQALDKVVEILKSSGSSELFNPDVDKDRRRHDPVTKDLLGALLANPVAEPTKNQQRRPSAEKIVSFTPRPSLPTLEVTPVQIGELLNTASRWNFDIFKLEEVTEKRPLLWLGMNILLRFDVTKTLEIEESVLQNWLTLIESNYHSSNSYHNSTHAADVLQSSAYFLEKPNIQAVLDPVDELVLLIGAIVHDVDHPGRNSAFLCNSGNPLAVLYNDTTVLENHHCALGYRLTISHPSVNIFKNLDVETYKQVRKGLIDTVLATDMSKHFVHLNKFTTAVGAAVENDCLPTFGLNESEERGIIKRMLIKCADVSNPARSLKLCKEWAVRIAEEYFAQTDEEKELGLPVVMPQFDRSTCSIPQSQIGFYDFFILSMFEAWNGYVECGELVKNIETNYEYWKSKFTEEQETGRRIPYFRGGVSFRLKTVTEDTAPTSKLQNVAIPENELASEGNSEAGQEKTNQEKELCTS